MAKKIFTLIHGEGIHASPGVKVFSSNAYSKVINAKEMLQTVQEDAEKYRKKVVEECEKQKEKAYQEGFEAGFSKWLGMVRQLEEKITEVHDEVHELVIPIALQAAKKIVGREIELNKDTILDIVKNKLKAVAQHKRIRIFVNKEDMQVLEKHKEDLKSLFEELQSLTLVEKNDITPGGCIIETDGGIINAQIENQWKLIEEAFEGFMQSQVEEEPEPKENEEEEEEE